jgi:CheY-like chemotaxis protein
LSGTKANVYWAHDGISGIEYCSRQKFDLIFLDIRLPDIDGYEINKRIKEIAPSTPIIAQTAYATYEDKKQLSSSGFVSYLIKPYSREDILGAIVEIDL